MKPYFTKYLPVEGEIKEGDTVLDTEGAYGIVENLNRPLEFVKVRYEKSFYADNLKENLTKVKLFLCSRDIQVGDKIYSFSRNVYDTVSNKHHIKLLEIQWRAWVKPIGEISPDATWVTEGMELERNDFEMRWTNSKGQYSLTKADVDRDTEEPILKAYIKGPCGHFH